VNDEPNAPFLKYGVNSRSHTYYKSLGNSVRITRFPICTAFEERCTNESSLEAGAIDESNGSATNSDQPTQAGRRYRDDLVTIRMARIRPPLLDLRVSRDPAAIRAIAADIASGQLLQLPDVRRLDDGSYRVVFGYTRVLASQELGRDKLDAKLIVCPGDNDEIMVGLTENLSRTDLTDTELARAFAMLKAQGKTGKEIAPLFRTNQSKVSRLGKVLQNPLLVLQRHFDVRTGLLPANGSLVGRERTRLGTEEQDKCRCSTRAGRAGRADQLGRGRRDAAGTARGAAGTARAGHPASRRREAGPNQGGIATVGGRAVRG